MHSRHDAREMKHLRGQVGQVGVKEDEERCDDLSSDGEPGRQGCQQAEEEADAQPAEAHHQHPAAPQQHVGPRHRWQTEERLKELVQRL